MKKMDGKVTIIMEFVNYCGDVVDETPIAEFRNINWAITFLKYIYQNVMEDNNGLRYRVEVVNGGVFYITKYGENKYVKEVCGM